MDKVRKSLDTLLPRLKEDLDYYKKSLKTSAEVDGDIFQKQIALISGVWYLTFNDGSIKDINSNKQKIFTLTKLALISLNEEMTNPSDEIMEMLDGEERSSAPLFENLYDLTTLTMTGDTTADELWFSLYDVITSSSSITGLSLEDILDVLKREPELVTQKEMYVNI